MSTKNSLTHTKKYSQILSAVHMVYRLVNSTYNVEELILRLTRLVCQFIKASSSSVYILDVKTKKVKLKAIFDNKINILVTKKKDLVKFSKLEDRVLKGYTVFEKNIIGIPLVADDNIGAIFVQRKRSERAFNEFDKDMLAVVAEQAVTAIKNIQLSEDQQNIILESMRLVGNLLEQHGQKVRAQHSPVYFKVVKSLGEKLNINQEGIDRLYYASILRDAGAIDIPYNILSKSRQLTPQEFKLIRDQPIRSVKLIKPVDFLKPVLPIILYHNEKYDGTGYPSGLKKEQIPLGARILHVVDAFEAMTSDRTYKRKLTLAEAYQELRAYSGSQFDPKVVDSFLLLSKHKKFRKHLSLLHK